MKYFKPRSLTWWASFVPLAGGVFMAAEPIHHLTDWVDSIQAMTTMTPAMMVNLGLLGIGIRGMKND